MKGRLAHHPGEGQGLQSKLLPSEGRATGRPVQAAGAAGARLPSDHTRSQAALQTRGRSVRPRAGAVLPWSGYAVCLC